MQKKQAFMQDNILPVKKVSQQTMAMNTHMESPVQLGSEINSPCIYPFFI